METIQYYINPTVGNITITSQKDSLQQIVKGMRDKNFSDEYIDAYLIGKNFSAKEIVKAMKIQGGLLQEILNFRKNNKTKLSTSHTMTIGGYKRVALDLLIHFNNFEVKKNGNEIELKIF